MMKQWIQRRIHWIDGQFLSAPALTRGPGNTRPSENTVTLRAASGKILYTLDGTDPRLPGGAPSPNAQAYSSAITLKPGARLVARAQSRGNWSAPTTATSGSDGRSLAGLNRRNFQRAVPVE